MREILAIIFLLITANSFAQKEFHVFPIDGTKIKGSPNGNGTLSNPWDLQTALSQSSERINGGDIIWLHGGIYNGNYKSTIASTIKDKYITVSSYKNQKVILNGNIEVKKNYVLEVKGNRVIYKDFEITYLGDFSRTKTDPHFRGVTGINHTRGEDCKFQNIVIHNIPGSGIGSWKNAGGSIIEDCIIYNNGYQGKRGHGVGIYVQNQSEKTRLLRNNIVFNNYYKGIEVWSATSGTKREFVKNVDIIDNIIFNNGIPSGKPWSNLIVASGDREGINVAKNINIKNNVFYHNVDFKDHKNFGHGNSITLGYSRHALVEDISVENNIIIGRNNAVHLNHVKSLDFKGNIVYTGYVHFKTTTLPGLENGDVYLIDNAYHTRKVEGLRILNHKDYKLSDWQKTFNHDITSEWKPLKDFEIDPLLNIEKLVTHPNEYNVALLDKNGGDVSIDFGAFGIEKGTNFTIYDVENRRKVLKSGTLGDERKITIPMDLTNFEKPLHNTIATKSNENFGVFRIAFEEKKINEKKKAKKNENIFKRFFQWLF